MREKECTKCGKTKSLNNFHKRGASNDGLAYWCKKCKSRHRKKHYRENREWELERNRRWEERNPEWSPKQNSKWSEENLEYAKQWRKRVREYDSQEKANIRRIRYRARKERLPDNWTASDQNFALKYWDNCCCYCNEELKDNLEWDHFFALSDDRCMGTIPENMLPSCAYCNRSKNSLSPYEWIKRSFDDPEIKIKEIEKYFTEVKESI